MVALISHLKQQGLRIYPFSNAVENFFSPLKTKGISRQKIQSFDQAPQLIDDSIYFYNYERYKLKYRLTPF